MDKDDEFAGPPAFPDAIHGGHGWERAGHGGYFAPWVKDNIKVGESFWVYAVRPVATDLWVLKLCIRISKLSVSMKTMRASSGMHEAKESEHNLSEGWNESFNFWVKRLVRPEWEEFVREVMSEQG